VHLQFVDIPPCPFLRTLATTPPRLGCRLPEAIVRSGAKLLASCQQRRRAGHLVLLGQVGHMQDVVQQLGALLRLHQLLQLLLTAQQQLPQAATLPEQAVYVPRVNAGQT